VLNVRSKINSFKRYLMLFTHLTELTACISMSTSLLMLAGHLFILHSVVTAVASHSQMIVEGLVSVQGLDSKGIFCLVLLFIVVWRKGVKC